MRFSLSYLPLLPFLSDENIYALALEAGRMTRGEEEPTKQNDASFYINVYRFSLPFSFDWKHIQTTHGSKLG